MFASAGQNWKGTSVTGGESQGLHFKTASSDLGFPSVLVYSGQRSPSLVPTVFNTATVNESFSS